MDESPCRGHDRDAEFETILRCRLLYPVYQPIVVLATGKVAGYEALIRGPAGSAFESPAALFGQALRTGRLGELDWAARAMAFRRALQAGLPYEMPLFVNVEPATLRTRCPSDLTASIDAGAERLQVVAEVTERFLGADPAALMMLMARVRGRGARMALDDVGSNPASLALMSLLNPEVIKLDRGIVQHPGTTVADQVVRAVRAQSARTGAIVLAEGIETPHHRATALAMGATHGQGWLFGRPGPLPARHEPPGPYLPRGTWPSARDATPFEIVNGHRDATRATKQTLIPVSTRLETMASRAPEAMVLLAAFQHDAHFGARVRARYAAWADDGAFIAVFAHGITPGPAPRLRGVPLAADDPLVGEWTLIVMDSYFAGGLLARELPTTAGSELHRQFDAIVTYDRALLAEAAHSLLERLDRHP
ncbi:sensor domain-containing phosphodiesterase [Catellatospora methionotrophica]|uniref:sensor domain-containing phosphodiesterase n=1 Tax=Catellatospora methionotrophica TaxID=121620 RepID=UPI0033D1548C